MTGTITGVFVTHNLLMQISHPNKKEFCNNDNLFLKKYNGNKVLQNSTYVWTLEELGSSVRSLLSLCWWKFLCCW